MTARNWKWMVPGVGFSIALLITNALLLAPFAWVRDLSYVSAMVMVICAIGSFFNLIDYRRAQAIAMLERKQNALSRTSLSVELEAGRGVHPESVKIILNERHRVWALRNGDLNAGVRAYDVLYHAPEVTIYFLEYFLKGSTERSVMPKRMLVEGRKNRFDPYGVVDEYTMYDRLVKLLVDQQKLHKWTEFDALYEWIHPWTPKLVAAEWGLEWEEPSVSSVPAAVAARIQ
jgi:hypothetical protein